MASKEVMVSAPLMVLLFERTFVAGSLAAAVRRSWPLYAGLASTWFLLLVLIVSAPTANRRALGSGRRCRRGGSLRRKRLSCIRS